jgi:uncharacterized protein YegP (UPF0339 family)
MATGKFEIYKDKAGAFRFRLKATNGQTILASEGYVQIAGAKNGIESVRKNAPDAARYENRESKGGKFSFVLKAANGQIIGVSEQYDTAPARAKGIASVQATAPGARLDDLTAG